WVPGELRAGCVGVELGCATDPFWATGYLPSLIVSPLSAAPDRPAIGETLTPNTNQHVRPNSPGGPGVRSQRLRHRRPRRPSSSGPEAADTPPPTGRASRAPPTRAMCAGRSSRARGGSDPPERTGRTGRGCGADRPAPLSVLRVGRLGVGGLCLGGLGIRARGGAVGTLRLGVLAGAEELGGVDRIAFGVGDVDLDDHVGERLGATDVGEQGAELAGLLDLLHELVGVHAVALGLEHNV